MYFWREHIRGHRQHAQGNGWAYQKLERTRDQYDMEEPAVRNESVTRRQYDGAEDSGVNVNHVD